MKINSQELMLLNKHMKFGEVPTETMPQPAESVAESPETTPEAGMNALNAKAQNNVAFQGVTMPATLRKGLSKMMLVLALGGGMASTATLTSCTKVEQSVDVDMRAFAELMSQLNAKMNEMIEQQKISNALQTEIRDTQLENKKILQGLYQNSELTLEEVQNFSSTVQNGMFDITAQLKENGATDKEILEVVKEYRSQINEAITMFKNHQISFLQLMQKIDEIKNTLGSIDGTLKDILAQVTGIRDDMNANHEELMAAKEEEIEYLGKIYLHNKAQTAMINKMAVTQQSMDEKIQTLTNNSDELLAIAKDDTKYNELMNKLDSLKPTDIDYQKFEQMFKLLNMNLTDEINRFREDNKAGQNALIGSINDFKKTYITTETKQSQQFAAIISKLNFIATYLPNLDQSAIEAAIKELTNAVNNNTGAIEDNTEVIGNGIVNINSKLDAVLDKLDKVIDNLEGLSTYFAEQQQNWNAALCSLGNVNTTLQKVLKESKVTNSILSSYKADFKEIKNNQKTANSYLNILISKQTALENAINNIQIDGGMTREEFLSAMEERDAKAAEEFRAFIKEYGFDKVSGDVQTIKEFLAELKNAVNNQKDYSSQLDRIINLENSIYNFLKNADFSNPDYTEKLDKILKAIENWKCDCECGKDSGKTDESIKDLEDMFS